MNFQRSPSPVLVGLAIVVAGVGLTLVWPSALLLIAVVVAYLGALCTPWRIPGGVALGAAAIVVAMLVVIRVDMVPPSTTISLALLVAVFPMTAAAWAGLRARG